MLRLFGYPQASGDRSFPARGFEVVAYVALSREQVATREEIALALWGDADRARSFANLRFVLAEIRRWQSETSETVLHISKATLRSAGASDLDQLLHLGAAETVSVEALEPLMGGSLLAGDSGRSDSLDNWITAARARVTDLRVELSLRVEGDAANVVAIVDRAMQHSPYDERLLKRQVQVLVAAGRSSTARSAVSNFESRLRKDLGVRPLQDIYSRLSDILPRSSGHGIEDPEIPQLGRSWSLPKVVVLGLGDGTPGRSPRLARAMLVEVNLALCSMRTFAMFAPYTARQLNRAPEAQAMELGADYAVITEMLASERMSFNLIRLQTRQILAAEVVNITSLGAAADIIARAVAAALSREIEATELSNYRQTGAASPYVHYVLGCERLQYDLPAIRKARSCFQRALDVYPRFAPAMAMLAKTLCLEWLVLRRTETDLLEAALEIAKKSVAIDPHIPSGHWSMGTSLLYLNRMDESLEHIQTARSRAPHMADLLADEGDLYVHAGHLDLALDCFDEAMRLNPLPPDDYHWLKGSAQFLNQDYAGALASLGQMDDQRQVGRMIAGSAAMIGDFARARHHREAWMEMYPDFVVADWAKQVPLRNRTHVEAGMEAMRRAGFV